jgi:serine/threonine-protein kinase
LDGAPNFCPACGEDLRGLTPDATTLSGSWAGALIDGRYRLTEKLGEGGMGTVYRVEHVRMGKILALKLLRPDIAVDKKIKQRFQQEARLVSKLSNPNTIQVFDFGELEDGSLYIAMEYLSGRDLAWTLRTHGPVPERRAISIICQVLASLAEAHEHKIIHRDIKPANIMLVKRRDGEEMVKVLDFGIAKLTQDEQRKYITGVADFLGTPAYMSPEQAKGEELDARSDLYSVGAVLFELVTGRGPFVGPTPISIITKHMSEPPPRFQDVAPEKFLTERLEQVVRKALSKRREDRFASADEMRSELERLRREIDQVSSHFTPVPDEISMSRMASREDFDRFERSLKLKRTITPLAALTLITVSAVGAFEYWQRRADEVFSPIEREPNNEPAEANRIALDQPIKGMIGAPLSQTESDRDLFLLDLPQPAVLTIELSGVPDMNLVLEVLQLEKKGPTGEPKLKSRLFLDDAPVGGGERVDGLAVPAGPVYIRVQERAYFTEPARPPRETTHSSYVLTVSRTQAEGQVEVEPNDTLESASRVAIGKAIFGFTGAAIPYTETFAEQVFSSPDFLVADLEGKSPTQPVFALAVPPRAGPIAVVDSAAFEAWLNKSKKPRADGRPRPPLPEPTVVSQEPKLIGLLAYSQGFGVRIQAADPSFHPGAQYAVAFVTEGETGLSSAIDLVRILARRGRMPEAQAVIRLVESRFVHSPQLAELRSIQLNNASIATEQR